VTWGREHKKLTPKDLQILEVCAAIPRKLPSDLQAQHAIEVLKRLRSDGFE
jgi:hypothetical protein